MFRYSFDQLIASKQQEEANNLLLQMKEKCVLHHSSKIEKAFQEYKINNYWYLEEMQRIAADCKENIVVVAVVRNNNTFSQVQWDIKKGYDKLNKPWSEPIPYIEYSFPENYDSPHGLRSKDVFILFFTKYHDFVGSRDCVLHYLRKFYNLRAFI